MKKRLSNRIASILLALSLLLSTFLFLPLLSSAEGKPDFWTDYAADAFAGGDGSEEDPFLISTPGQLARMSKLINEKNTEYTKAHYLLTDDVDLSGHLWSPIGKYAYSVFGDPWDDESGYGSYYAGDVYPEYMFEGVFDGGEHVVKNMSVECETNVSCYGFFGSSVGTIRNLTLEHPSITGEFKQNACLYIGCIIGYGNNDLKKDSSLSNCQVIEANVHIINHGLMYIGSAIGTDSGCDMFNVNCSGEIRIDSVRGCTVGGLIGSLSGANISFCSFVGRINYNHDILGVNELQCSVYGLIGEVWSNLSVSDCFVYADISTTISEDKIEAVDFGALTHSWYTYHSGTYHNIILSCNYSRNNQEEYIGIADRFYPLYSGKPGYLEYNGIVMIEDQTARVYRYSLIENMNAEEVTEYPLSEQLFTDVLELDENWNISSGELPGFIDRPEKRECVHNAVCGRFSHRITIVSENMHSFQGDYIYYCSICGEYLYKMNQTISEPHNFSFAVVQEPTDTEKGTRTRTCTECGYTVTEEISWTNEHCIGPWTEGYPATYDQDGLRGYYYCSDCGKYLDRDFNEITDLIIPSSLYCDLTGDYAISISDVTKLLNILSGNSITAIDCDLNRDGTTSVSDVTFLLDLIAKL